MVEKIAKPARDIIDFDAYRTTRARKVEPLQALRGKLCRYCGAVLDEDESEEECSSRDAAIGPRFRATGV